VCLGGRVICVIVKETAVSPEIKSLRKEFARCAFAWLVGIENLPYGFMKKGHGAWLYNPRRDAFAHAENLAGLRELLETLENGQVSWIKRTEMLGL
jgi:hypothetical protein